MSTSNHYLIQPLSAMRRHPQMIPDTPGLYALVLDNPDALDEALDKARLKLEAVYLGRRPLLYVGSTEDSLRRRLTHHMSDDTCRSTFRMSLGALLAEELQLVVNPIPGQNYFGFEPDSEMILSRWIAQNVSVALRPHSAARKAEAALILKAQPPLNIAGRGESPGSQTMARLRRRCRGIYLNKSTLN